MILFSEEDCNEMAFSLHHGEMHILLTVCRRWLLQSAVPPFYIKEPSFLLVCFQAEQLNVM